MVVQVNHMKLKGGFLINGRKFNKNFTIEQYRILFNFKDLYLKNIIHDAKIIFVIYYCVYKSMYKTTIYNFLFHLFKKKYCSPEKQLMCKLLLLKKGYIQNYSIDFLVSQKPMFNFKMYKLNGKYTHYLLWELHHTQSF